MQGTEHDIAFFLALGCAADAGLFLHIFGVLGRLGPHLGRLGIKEHLT